MNELDTEKRIVSVEMFGHAGGNEWIVSHYLFENSAIHNARDILP
jgi:hypothetical protein